MKQRLKQKTGFTLVEALIVLAILGVLAAVAIPAYSIQLENSRIKVDEATLASAGSMAVSDYLLRSGGTSNVSYIYFAFQKKVGNNTEIQVFPTVPPMTQADRDQLTAEGWGDCLPNSHKYQGKTIFIQVKDGTLITCDWR